MVEFHLRLATNDRTWGHQNMCDVSAPSKSTEIRIISMFLYPHYTTMGMTDIPSLIRPGISYYIYPISLYPLSHQPWNPLSLPITMATQRRNFPFGTSFASSNSSQPFRKSPTRATKGQIMGKTHRCLVHGWSWI